MIKDHTVWYFFFAALPLRFREVCVVYPTYLPIREVFKKKTEQAVRLTAWVDPPPAPMKRSGKCEIFLTLTFDFSL